MKDWQTEKTAKSWTGLGFKGLVTDIKSKWGAGRASSRPTRGPRGWEVIGPFAALSRRAGGLSPGLGGIRGLRPGLGRTRLFGGLSAEFLLS